ncbi:hypothetical protein AMAG_08333 [Allomyces macrogynus ATCC 38327]|uniref:RING-type domain-containing protein n=1 Tax=Allomyces macrogynus (strain ATCC 38327) TaxID=578462 RepID=A0A0L0SLB4_ALLM3|nr:hypothetical protein AMAG_08333 [Allomyces macrogynus ATCC 38327]|eukprot:KNE63179.1 hypothetical protein AMAG_08333 [Allomyces macrogynus ATCC 38327]
MTTSNSTLQLLFSSAVGDDPGAASSSDDETCGRPAKRRAIRKRGQGVPDIDPLDLPMPSAPVDRAWVEDDEHLAFLAQVEDVQRILAADEQGASDEDEEVVEKKPRKRKRGKEAKRSKKEGKRERRRRTATGAEEGAEPVAALDDPSLMSLMFATGLVSAFDSAPTATAPRGAPAYVIAALPRVAHVLSGADDRDDQCVVCLHALSRPPSDGAAVDGDSLVPLLIPLPCLHTFHEECAVKCLEARPTCPVCRFDVVAAYT